MTDALTETLIDNQQKYWTAFCDAAKKTGSTFSPDDPGAKALATAFGFSEFVCESCVRHPEMALDLIDSGNLVTSMADGALHGRLQSFFDTTTKAAVAEAAPSEQLLPGLKTALRQFRRREMVRIAVRDLAGLAQLEETMTDLSALARAAIDGALEPLYASLCGMLGVPRDSGGIRQRLVVLGMGKLGAGELNFSSDVDLIFVFPSSGETRGGNRAISNETFFTRLCRYLIQAIGEQTVDGYVFRVDTRLRPYGDGGPLVMNFDHMEDYYQSQGREWERYALIKAAVVAGDADAGTKLLGRLRPFVFRRYLDFGVFESLREMKQKITAEVRRKNLHDNIKLGGGGIREIEFFGQMFQLIRGGVLPALQQPGIQDVLDTLHREGIVPLGVCRELKEAYRFLRMAEHRLQEENDKQTHALPEDALDRHRLARAMGFEDWRAFLTILDDHRDRVRRHFGGLLETKSAADSQREEKAAGNADLADAWSLSGGTDERAKLLAAAGFKDGDTAVRYIDTFKKEPATRALSGSGRRRLDRLMPRVLESVAISDDPEMVLDRMLQLLKCVQQRTSYLSLLIEYPTALNHLIRLIGASPWIAHFLSQHPALLDELLDPRTLYTPPRQEALRQGLAHQLTAVPAGDTEYLIEALCIFRQVNMLRVAASDITSVLPLMKVSDRLTWIAETILERVVEISWNDLVEKHGRPSCTLDGKACSLGFAVIGYGKLGGIELGYGSDLDLVFLHAADPGTTKGGRNPIDNSHFFARLGQRVVHMLSAHTAAGTLYEVDMRLRPNGGAGLLVSHVNGFGEYQLEKAWTWEHQALIRARPITGDTALLDAFSAIRQKALCLPREEASLKTEVREMRERMREHRLKATPDRFDIKDDTGAIVDIEFLVQYLVLRHATEHPEITRWTDNVRLLQALSEARIVDEITAYRLRRAYLIYRAAAHRLNLKEQSTLVDEKRFSHLKRFVETVWKTTLTDARTVRGGRKS